MKNRLTAIFLALVIAFSLFASCSSAPESEKTEQDPKENSNEADNKEAAKQTGYVFAELNCNGEDFTILNTINEWEFYSDIIFENMTGEVLDDAIYTRTRLLEEKFNVNIKEVSAQVVSEVASKLRNAVLADENIYDVSFCPISESGQLISLNMLYDLNGVQGLNLGENWWNQSIMENITITSSKSVYFAFSDIHIFALQCALNLYINEKMIENLGLEKPYGIVRSGKWTYDKFYEYMKAGAQLNGDASFKWSDSGNAVYGYTSFLTGTKALLTGSGEILAENSGDGMPRLTVGHERFYNVCDKIADMLSRSNAGGYEHANAYHTPYHFEAMFANDRAFMMGGELKAANSIRAMETVFGILPIPKYDETQTRYWSYVNPIAPALMIPVTNANLERAGIIIDAMAYLSTKDVMPVFFDVNVSQKQLRNEESIEMLQIIRDTLVLEMGLAYGWTTQMSEAIVNALDLGKSDGIASIIEKQTDRAQANIDAMMELIEGAK
ncbi:MAG: hypothetical protein FWD23_15765 [Oscillospiraceae bacterium]|nr:hypothetical protein [Oscillospiraceae bacterium]